MKCSMCKLELGDIDILTRPVGYASFDVHKDCYKFFMAAQNALEPIVADLNIIKKELQKIKDDVY